jgi:hypothetical protein
MAKRERLSFEAWALMYVCPRCGAAAGDRCTKEGPDGKGPTSGPHTERVDLMSRIKRGLEQRE